MAETIIQQKRQKILMNVFVLLILVVLIFYFRTPILELIKKRAGTFVFPPPIYPPPLLEKIKINFEVLQSSYLKELLLFEKLPEFKETPGRENPFSPISIPKP